MISLKTWRKMPQENRSYEVYKIVRKVQTHRDESMTELFIGLIAGFFLAMVIIVFLNPFSTLSPDTIEEMCMSYEK